MKIFEKREQKCCFLRVLMKIKIIFFFLSFAHRSFFQPFNNIERKKNFLSVCIRIVYEMKIVSLRRVNISNKHRTHKKKLNKS